MSRRWYAVGLLGSATIAVAYIAGVVGPVHRPSGDPAFLPPDAELELLVDGANEDLNFTEGVVVTCDRRVLFSDIPTAGANGEGGAGRILEYHPDSKAISVFRSPSNGANGNRMDLACRLLTAERHRLVRTDLVTGRVEVVLGSEAGGSFDALNDIAMDSNGRIYVTHPRYGPGEPGSLRKPGVYRIDPDGRATRVISDAARPNGITICPDQRQITVGSYDYEADADREMALLATTSRRMAPPPTVGCWSTTLLSTVPTAWYATAKATCGWRSEIPVGPASTPIRWRTGSRRKELTFRRRSSRPTSTSAAVALRTTCTSPRAPACTASASANAVTTFKGGRDRGRHGRGRIGCSRADTGLSLGTGDCPPTPRAAGLRSHAA